LEQRLGRVLHAEHGNRWGEDAAGYDAFVGTSPFIVVSF